PGSPAKRSSVPLLDALLRFQRLSARPYGLAVNPRHVPRRDQFLAGAAEACTNQRHHPVGHDEAAEDTEHHVSARVDPAYSPEQVHQEHGQANHDQRGYKDLYDERGEVQVEVVEVVTGKPAGQVLVPLRRRRTVVTGVPGPGGQVAGDWN